MCQQTQTARIEEFPCFYARFYGLILVESESAQFLGKCGREGVHLIHSKGSTEFLRHVFDKGSLRFD